MSHDVVQETAAPEVQQPVQREAKYVEPLTRTEREELNALSLKAYGRKLEWQKQVRKGEYKPETSMTSGGDPIQAKRWHPISVDEIAVRMEKVLTDREEQAKKAAEEAALKAQGENNGEGQETNENEVAKTESAGTGEVSANG